MMMIKPNGKKIVHRVLQEIEYSMCVLLIKHIFYHFTGCLYMVSPRSRCLHVRSAYSSLFISDVHRRAHPGSNRTWDNALGAVPIESATRWKQCEQQREKQMKREDRGDYNVPPPRTPQKATVCYSA